MLQITNYRVAFNVKAQKEIDKLLDYYHIISADLYKDLLMEYDKTIERLSFNPNLNKIRKSKFRRVNLIKFPIMFIYTYNEKTKIVNIISAHHQNIKPSKIYKI